MKFEDINRFQEYIYVNKGKYTICKIHKNLKSFRIIRATSLKMFCILSSKRYSPYQAKNIYLNNKKNRSKFLPIIPGWYLHNNVYYRSDGIYTFDAYNNIKWRIEDLLEGPIWVPCKKSQEEILMELL